MLSLYLLRHARAASGSPDAARPLTAEGREQARRVGAVLGALRSPEAATWCSPALRCRETAEGLNAGTATVREGLALDAPLAEALSLARQAPSGTVLVGHQPELLSLAAALLPQLPTVGLPPASLIGLHRDGDRFAWSLYLEPEQSSRLAGRLS